MTKRVLFAGDTHGNIAWWRQVLLPVAEQHEVDLIIQVGDFGIWPGKTGQRYLNALNKATKVPIWFVRGNHDDTTQLVLGGANEKRTLYEIRPKIFQIVDGAMIDIDGHTLLGIGGAVSVDKEWRVEGESWWPDERTTIASVERAVYSEPRRVVDIVVSHDVPELIDIVNLMYQATGLRMKNDIDSHANRAVLGVLFQKLQPRKPLNRQMKWIHGHYHFSYSLIRNHIRFLGLDCDQPQKHKQDSWTILEVGNPVVAPTP